MRDGQKAENYNSNIIDEVYNSITEYEFKETEKQMMDEIKIHESINLKTEYLKDEDCVNISFKIDGKSIYFDVYLDDLQVVCNVFQNKKQIFNQTIEGIKK